MKGTGMEIKEKIKTENKSEKEEKYVDKVKEKGK